jgi:lantibiotic biosynthesis protein
LSCSRWQPILEGPLASLARETIFDIAASLQRSRPSDPSVARGQASLALLYGYLARLHPETGEALSREHLRQAIETLSQTAAEPSLFTGFPGVAFAVELLQGTEEGEDDPNEPVDAALEEYLDRPGWTGDYELVFGLVGLGVYALERLPRPSARSLLALILGHLEETAERLPEGIAWRTPAAPGGEATPLEHYNAGLAHGIPGVIALLGRMCRAGFARERALPLLRGAVRWLLAQRLPPSAASCFPSMLLKGVAPSASRHGWCYGDPGVAAALLVAARGAREPAWEEEALRLMRLVLRRPAGELGLEEPTLCHGTAGLAHLLNRFYQASGEEEFREGARVWFAETLARRTPGQGTGGYLFSKEEDGTRVPFELPGLMNGPAGIALALLSAVSPLEPGWDRLFLLSPL